MPKRRKTTRKKLRRIVVRSERRSEPDWDRFAWALLQHARMVSEAEQQSKQQPKDEHRA
jgi:hypothetical protein